MNTTDLIQSIRSNTFNSDFSLFQYSDIEKAKDRYINAVEEFEKLFGKRDVFVVSAPGRTELSGNHTDHQGGCVLAASVNLDVIAIVSKREDTLATVASYGFAPFTIDISDTEIKKKEKGMSDSILRGVAKKISTHPSFEKFVGFDAYTTSFVPKGSGLSSSAAFEVLLGKIISHTSCSSPVSDQFLAEAGFFAEYNYFGKPCGKMDQYACATGGVVYIDFKNEDPVWERVDVSFEKLGYTLFITNAGGNHASLTPEYAAIPNEMRSVAACFNKMKLSEVEESEFFKALPSLRNKASDRALSRALHYFTENSRVKNQLKALENGNVDRYLDLMQESGDSSLLNLQNIYPASNIDERSVSLALGLSKYFGGISRVHGGGFAGTIQALVKNENAEEYKLQMEKIFGNGTVYPISIRPVGAYVLGEVKNG